MFSARSERRRGTACQLLERDWELAAAERALASGHAGAGAVVFIEGEPGSGRSRLLSACAELAAKTDMTVLGGRAAELEQDFPFGLAIQLFEPLWLAADAERRASLARGSARHASALFDGSIVEVASEPGAHYTIIHGLFGMLRQLVAPGPDAALGSDANSLALLVDDAHWSDLPSLRFLAYLAERVRQFPVTIVLTAQLGEPGAEPKALASLRRAAQGSVLRTGPLSLAAVTTIVHRQFPDADAPFCEACARISGGNPFLLLEFLGKLREEEKSPELASTERLAGVLPDKVTAAMAARVGAMPGAARALARAVAVLGSASVRQGATMAEIDVAEAARVADVLAAAGLLHPGLPLSFVHPLLREAVLATLSPLERSQLHATAARVLAGDGADAERIADHLLEAPPAHDDAAIAALRAAARSALESGRSDQAAALLERALAERPSDELRASLTLVRAEALHDEHRYPEAAELLEGELADARPADAELADDLDAAYVSAASLAPGCYERSRAVRDRLVASLPAEPSRRQRRAVAYSLVRESLLGAPRAEIRRLADLVWADGKLLTDPANGGLAQPLLAAALLSVDELERMLELSDDTMRAWALAEQGQLGHAVSAATAALSEPVGHRPVDASIALAPLALCHLERGELEQADDALDRLADAALPDWICRPVRLELRARLRLAQHRPEQALRDVSDAAQALQSGFGTVTATCVPTGSTAALAHLALGQANEARRLAEEELAQVRRSGATRAVIRALRVLGLATGGSDGTELLAQAVELGAASPPRLEYIHALVDLGALLRRTNRRADARDPLRRGLELAERGDVTALVRRARTELLATTSRPDLVILSGAESLTASQRRVAELAAKGLTTREIAEALFVRPKTVEFHLRQIYRKLDITSREDLAGVLRSQPSEGRDEDR